MKRFLRLFGALAVLASLLVVLSSCGSQNALSQQNVYKNDQETKTITWGVKADTKLFGLMDIKDNQVKGFEIDLAKALTKEIYGKNAVAKFTPVTSQTRIPLLKNGNIDAIIATMTITPDRAKKVDFTKSYFDAGQALLVKTDSPIRNVQDLNQKGKIVLGVTGSNSVQNIAKVAPKAKVLELSDYAQALTALKSGQGDALTTDNGILLGMEAENPGYSVVGGNFTQEPYGIAVNKNQKDMRSAMNKALVKVEKDGTYNELLYKWFGNLKGFNYEEVKR